MTTQGRKPLPSAIRPPLEINEELLHSDMEKSAALPGALASAQANAVALAKDLSYDGALTIESLEEEIKFYQRRSVESVLEVGKRLLLLKEVTGHGNFVERIEALGIGERMAQRFMASTLKFSKASSTTLLTLPNLNQGKLLELLILDDGEIEALNNGDDVRGIQLDDVDCMSVSELRRALRKEKADRDAAIARAEADASGQIAAKDRLLAEKTKRISELVEEKNRRDIQTDSERYAELEERLGEAAFGAVCGIFPVRAAIDHIRALDHVPQGLYVAMQAALHRVLTEVESIASDYGVCLDFGLPTLSTADAFAAGDFDDPNAGEVFDQAPTVQ